MKKFLTLLTIVSFMAIGASAYAQESGIGAAVTDGDNVCQCEKGKGKRGHGGKGKGPKKEMPEPTVTSVEQAAEIAQEKVSEKFKGYTLGETTAHEGRRGNTGYTVMATDASGNEFVFMVNSWGKVRGPLPADVLERVKK